MPISLDQFQQNLLETEILTTEQLQSFLLQLPADKPVSTAKELAAELVRAEKLTPFQATHIYQNAHALLNLGNYLVQDKLGEGGMGMVFKAVHRRMKRVVALKVLSPNVTRHPDGLKRFQREVQVSARLSHTNIVTAFDADEAQGIHYLVMEYVEGIDLGNLVKQRGRLSPDRAIDCILQAARGLEFAHQRGVVHRDIKPSNLVLDAEGTVKVLDLGLAGIDETQFSYEKLTKTGTALGTIDYMSPEQARDTSKADARSDIYSLGCTLHYLLIGRSVYGGATFMSRLRAHVKAPVPDLTALRDDVPRQLSDVFQRMLAKNVEDRQQSMEEVIAQLEQLSSVSRTEPASAPTHPVAAGGDEAEMKSFLERLSRDEIPALQAGALPQTAEAEARPTETYSQADVTASLDDSLKTLPAVPVRPAEKWKSRSRNSKRRAAKAIPLARQKPVIAAIAGAALFVVVCIVVLAFRPNGGDEVASDDDAAVVGGTGNDVSSDEADHGNGVGDKVDEDAQQSAADDVMASAETQVASTDVGQIPEERTEPFPARSETAPIVQSDTALPPDPTTTDPSPSNSPAGEDAPDQPPLLRAPFTKREADENQRAWAKHLGLPAVNNLALGPGVTLRLVLIPPGEFMMGTTEEEQNRFREQARGTDWAYKRIGTEVQHTVRITQPFYMAAHEMTQAQWAVVMGNNPAKYQGNLLCPVESVSWNDVQPLLEKLNQTLTKPGLTFALPTEAQWEYACRAGTTTAWYSGDQLISMRTVGWYRGNIRAKQPYPVGQLKPNAFGLYDMHGNVKEWCADWYAEDYYEKSPMDDPAGPEEGTRKINRSGSVYEHTAEYESRSAFRGVNEPEYRDQHIGFRLAVQIDAGKLKSSNR